MLLFKLTPLCVIFFLFPLGECWVGVEGFEVGSCGRQVYCIDIGIDKVYITLHIGRGTRDLK
jgi:hypothetical protein